MFAIYMILVTLLLVNMLIAMMGNTYQLVNETQKEWFRQVKYQLSPLYMILVTLLLVNMLNYNAFIVS
jgi:cell division protein FtsX